MADEGVELFPKNPGLTEAALGNFASSIAGNWGSQLVTAYSTPGATPEQIQFSITTDWLMAFGMRRWAEYQARLGQPTYFYYVDHVPPAFHIYMPDDPDLQLPAGRRSGGAYHSGDLALVFGTTDKVGLDWTEDDHQVSRHMVRYWATPTERVCRSGLRLTALMSLRRSLDWCLSVSPGSTRSGSI
jgi:para-nitrobenzyl esterase